MPWIDFSCELTETDKRKYALKIIKKKNIRRLRFTFFWLE